MPKKIDPTDQAMMLDVDNQIICRRNLDLKRGNPWICECPRCLKEKQNGKSAKMAPSSLADDC